MNHINADQLREYHFNLLEDAERAETTAHLETCAECRAELDEVITQFAALDVLRDQPTVSKERLEAVLVEGRKVEGQRSKIIAFRPWVLLAAAASIAIAFMLARPGGLSDDGDVASTMAEASRTAGILPAPSLAELRAEQPFAPASNIELNVLPRRDEVRLTIYNAEDLTLVREKRKMTLKRGWNWLQFMWSNTLIDPTSLELTPVTHADQIEITQLVYPPRLNELARWTIFSEFGGEAEFELTYLTSGLKWNANYEATLSPDEQTMQLKSRVRVDNHSGEDYENAQTRLVVGEINLKDKIAALAKRQHAYGSPVSYHRKNVPPKSGEGFSIAMPEIRDFAGGIGNDKKWDFDGFDQKKIIKQALSEYQLYTIEGRETIPDGWGKRLPNFEAREIGVTNLYKFDEARWRNQTMRFLSFANTEACKLGDTPLPEGQVRLFKHVDGTGCYFHKLAYVGAAQLQYIPVGEEVELELGAAAKVKVEPKLMKIREENHRFDSKGNIAEWDEVTRWTIEITNTKTIPVEVEVMRGTHVAEWTLRTDAEFEKYDATHFRFTESVAPRSKRIIEYELTVQHGTRSEK